MRKVIIEDYYHMTTMSDKVDKPNTYIVKNNL